MITVVCKCGGWIRDGSCGRCGYRKRDEEESSHRRGYDRRWRTFSHRFRVEHPLCEDCLERGLTRPSTEVHHIQKLRDRPELKYDTENLMALCSECHHVRTMRGE